MVSTLAFVLKITKPIFFFSQESNFFKANINFLEQGIFPQPKKFSLTKEFFHSPRKLP